MTDYAEMPGLRDLYLEDSYVLDIVEGPDHLTFSMSADGTYEVAGDWGRVRVWNAQPPRFTMRDAT
jgi:hypothetical protein